MSKLWLFNKKYLYPRQDPDMKGYWALEEASGTRYDKTVNANNLTDNNTVLQGTGIKGNCADFEADNSESLSITHAAQTGLNFASSFTVGCWIKPESVAAWRGIMGKAVASTGWELGTGSVGTQIDFSVNQNHYVTAAQILEATYWYFFVVRYTAVGAGTSLVDIFQNAQRIKAITNAALLTQETTSIFYLGRGLVLFTPYWDGLIDEAFCYNGLISDTDILWLYLYGLSKVGGGVYTGTPQVSAGFGGGV